MTGRDRYVLTGVVVLVVLAAAWLLVVSPERKQAASLNAQVASAQTELSSAEGKLANARTAETQYSSAYAALVSLGKAVPTSEEVPSLIYQLSSVSAAKKVTFASIVSGGGVSTSATTVASAGTETGFTQMPFTFTFEGSFFDLEKLFRQLTAFTNRTPSGALEVSGRLLTIQSVKLAPQSGGEGEKSGNLAGTVSATAYVLPPSAATATSATSAGSTPASSTSSSSSSPTAPAVVAVKP